MQKTFSTLEILNICGWYKQIREKEDKPLNDLPLKVQWDLKKNINAMGSIADDFLALQKENEDELKSHYVDDEHSFESVDEEGNPVRKIKDEYLADFQAAVTEMNKKLTDILEETNDIEIKPIDVDAVVESLGDNEAKLTVDDLEILSVFNEDKNN